MVDVFDTPLLAVFTVHLFICPFTKVEESFNTQAMHDLLYHGKDISKYDHLEFPGVVPRTFLGPLVVSAVAYPVVTLYNLTGASKLSSQFVVRFCLGSIGLFAFSKFRTSISRRFGFDVGFFVVLITITQFHFLFYISRPLPNTFALVLVLLALGFWLDQHHSKFIWTSAFAIIIFRSELCILLGLIFVLELVTLRVSLFTGIIHSASAGLSALALTVSVDSVFWRRYLWPEGEVLWYNTVQNKSSHWGGKTNQVSSSGSKHFGKAKPFNSTAETFSNIFQNVSTNAVITVAFLPGVRNWNIGTSPFLWYFYSVLPRCLLFALLLVPVGLWRDRRTWTLAAPSIGFVFLYSFLPHKELRFIIYVVPVFNTVAACGMSFIYKNEGKWRPLVSTAVKVITMGGLLGNCMVTVLLLLISHRNYPGGVALQRLHKLLDNETGPCHVHISVAAAQTGVSRFGEINPKWRYSKAEDVADDSIEIMTFSHLLAEPPCNRMGHSHSLLEKVEGFDKVHVDVKRFPFIISAMAPKICILERSGWRKTMIEGA